MVAVAAVAVITLTLTVALAPADTALAWGEPFPVSGVSAISVDVDTAEVVGPGIGGEKGGVPQAGGPPQAPQVFVGTATVNGTLAAAGTPLTAWDGAKQVGAAVVGESGSFVIQVARSSGVITFRIGGSPADRTHPAWTPGLVTTGFDLTAGGTTGCLGTNLGAATPAIGQQGGSPPHVFVGQALVQGVAPPPGAPVTAWDGDRQIGYTATGADGAFTLTTARAAGEITFRVDGRLADRTQPRWTLGQVTTGFNLNAAADCLEGTPPATVAEALDGRFVRAFTFDNERKEWRFYDPRAGQANTLGGFVSGQSYLVLVTETVGVSLNGKYRNLSCVAGNCWNLIVW